MTYWPRPASAITSDAKANSVYGETWNGVQTGVLHHNHYFDKPIDPYVVPGDQSSGVLPRVSTTPPGKKGDGDDRLQAYCFRMCLTNVDENRVPFPKPLNYDAAEYELLGRVLDAGWKDLFRKFDRMPNRKTDTNNHGPFSTDNIGRNYDYADASYQRRQEIIREHEQYQQGLMYFLANEPRVPEKLRSAMAKWGLCKDEFKDNGHWPHQLYIREARRMVGNYVMTEHDCLDTKETPDSIGMGSYTLDSHNVQRYIKPDGFVQNEGDIGVKAPRPYEIAYGSIVPKPSQCKNLLVPVCVSSSHIAFGSIRMEPVFMILGQSAATAACLSIDEDCAVQDLSYAKLKERLVADRQILEYGAKYAQDSKQLPGIVVDNREAKLSGKWTTSSTNSPYVNDDYQHNGNTTTEDKQATYATKLEPGRYTVGVSYPVNKNRATNVPVTIYHRDNAARLIIDQTKTPKPGPLFHQIGTYDFGDSATVEIRSKGTDGYVIVDAVQFLPAD